MAFSLKVMGIITIEIDIVHVHVSNYRSFQSNDFNATFSGVFV